MRLFTGTLSPKPMAERPPKPRHLGIGARIIVFAFAVIAWAATAAMSGFGRLSP